MTMNAVFLFEGTGNSLDKNPSAISELYYRYEVDHFRHRRILPKNMFLSNKQHRLINDPIQGQVVKLISGSGTHGCFMYRLYNRITGADWDVIVKKQYERLLRIVKAYGNCKIRLYVFGFSRGAFQAKLFVNGISYFGLSKTSEEFITAIRKADKSKLEIQKNIPTIRFLGLLDTVSHTKMKQPFGWEDVGIPPTVNRCRHAVAINEYRKRFTPQILKSCGCDSNVEEQWFIGCHSDIGWAYNGVRSKYNNQAYTHTYGKMALTWLLEPVKNEIKGDLSEFEELNHTAKDFLGLLRYFVFVIHKSFEDSSNTFGCSCIRNTDCKSDFHHSVRGILALRDVQGLNRVMIPVRRCGWLSLRNNRYYISLRDLISQMEHLKGGRALGPTFENKEEMMRILKQLKMDGIDRWREAYHLLKNKDVIQHSWLDELFCAVLCGQ